MGIYGCCVPKNGLGSNVVLEKRIIIIVQSGVAGGRMRWLSSLLRKTESKLAPENWVRKQLRDLPSKQLENVVERVWKGLE